MSIFVTGDIHGCPKRLNTKWFPYQKKFKSQEDNFVVILGDFGLVWDYRGENPQENYWLNWLEEKNFTTLFIDGNHENYDRLDAFPTEEWNGGKVSYIRPHVIHLKRGQVFEIEGKKIFTFGGASSHDIQDGILEPNDPKIKEWEQDYFKMFRVNHQSWWERELPSKEEMEEGIANLAKHNNKVDYIFTHCPYTSLLAQMGAGLYHPDYLSDYLQTIKQTVEYDGWYFGHMHIDKPYYFERAICMYESVSAISYGKEQNMEIEFP